MQFYDVQKFFPQFFTYNYWFRVGSGFGCGKTLEVRSGSGLNNSGSTTLLKTLFSVTGVVESSVT
jgi:hypothetical protein